MKIIEQVHCLFDEENEKGIKEEDFMDKENLTIFFHALANVAPTMLYNRIVQDDKNYLEFNHLANDLCFQYMESEE
jgi:hypothetical protein